MDLLTLAKAAGPVSSGIFAGYAWALTDATVPCILDGTSDEASQVRMWRIQFIRGFIVWLSSVMSEVLSMMLEQIAVPCTIINIASWAYLTFHAPESSLARILFVTAAATTGSGTVFAWTFLRAVNGAGSIRAEELAGPWTGDFTVPLTYSSKEKASIGLEKKSSTAQIVQRWASLNVVRSVILIAGTIAGAVGLALL